MRQGPHKVTLLAQKGFQGLFVVHCTDSEQDWQYCQTLDTVGQKKLLLTPVFAFYGYLDAWTIGGHAQAVTLTFCILGA